MIDKDLIFTWLRDFGAEPKEDTADSADWVVQGSFMNLGFVVLQPTGKDCIQLQRGMEISEEHVAKLKSLSASKYQAFLYQLKRGYLLSNIRYQLFFPGNGNGILERVLLSCQVYEDGLSKERFFDKLYKLHDAAILLIVELKHL